MQAQENPLQTLSMNKRKKGGGGNDLGSFHIQDPAINKGMKPSTVKFIMTYEKSKAIY